MLLFCITLIYGTRPVRDVDIIQYYGKTWHRPDSNVVIIQYGGKIWHLSSQGCCYFAILSSNTAPVQSGMLRKCSIMVKYDTRPVRDVVIFAKLRSNNAPVQPGMLIFCNIMLKYGTRPVRDVDILQHYAKIRHPSSQGCCYNSVWR